MPNTSTWKSVERRLCRMFRGERAPLSGRNGGAGTSGDYVGCAARAWAYIEIKHRAKSALFTLWRDTCAKAKAERRTPLVLMHEKGERGAIAVVDAAWLAALLDAAEDRGVHKDGAVVRIET